MKTYYHRRIAPSEIGRLPIQPPVCDFCALHAPEFIYAASKRSDGAPGFCWRWCACPECHALIQAENFAPMIDNIARGLGATMPNVPLLIRRMAATRSLREFNLDVWYTAPATE